MRKEKILLMDDEASTRLFTTLNLRSLKYEVEEAINVRCSMLTPLAKSLLVFINFDSMGPVETNLLSRYDQNYE